VDEPQRIKAAIEMCDKPPSILDFLELLSGERTLRQNEEKLIEISNSKPAWIGDNRDWARQIKYKKKLGEHVSPFCWSAAQQALKPLGEDV